jgi:hypothetical protein
MILKIYGWNNCPATYYRGHPKVNVFFYSLIFTLNHRRPKMSKFDNSDKKIIETIFFLNATSHSDADSYGYCKVGRKLVVGCCGERITLQ